MSTSAEPPDIRAKNNEHIQMFVRGSVWASEQALGAAAASATTDVREGDSPNYLQAHWVDLTIVSPSDAYWDASLC